MLKRYQPGLDSLVLKLKVLGLQKKPLVPE